jgi:hypothetical protein
MSRYVSRSIPTIPLDKLEEMSKEMLISHLLNMQGRVRELESELLEALTLQQSGTSHRTLGKRTNKGADTHMDNANKRHCHRTAKEMPRIMLASELIEYLDQEDREAEERAKLLDAMSAAIKS